MNCALEFVARPMAGLHGDATGQACARLSVLVPVASKKASAGAKKPSILIFIVWFSWLCANGIRLADYNINTLTSILM